MQTVKRYPKECFVADINITRKNKKQYDKSIENIDFEKKYNETRQRLLNKVKEVEKRKAK